MKYKLLRFSLLSILAMLGGLWGNGAWAADKWVKTDVSDLKTGDVVVIVDQTSSTAMSNDNGTSAAPSATEVTLSDDFSEISGDAADNLQWVVTVSNGSYKFNVADTENYLYCTNTNNGVRVGTNENNAFTITQGGDNNADFLMNTATSRYIGVYNNQDWRCYTSINANIKATVTAFYKLTEDASDTRTATTVSVGADQTGTVGTAMELPLAVVNDAAGAPIEGATVVWSSSNEQVAQIDGTVLNLLAIGESTIKATFAGDDNYKGSKGSFKVTVTNAPYTSIAAMLADITSTKTTANYKFENLLVTYVQGSNTYVSDGTNGFLFYGSDLGLNVGEKITGSVTGQLYTYNGLPEMALSADGINVQVTSTDNEVAWPAIAPADLQNYINIPVTIENAVFVETGSGKNLTFKVGDEEFAVYNNWSIPVGGLKADATYTLTGVGSVYSKGETTTYQLYLVTFEATGEQPVDTRLDVTLSFPQESYEAIMGEDFEEPVLTVDPVEYDGMISYKSSDASVATVSYEGEVTLVAPGTVIITAEAMASQTYKEAEASYTLIVNERETPPEPEELANPYTYTFEAKTFEKESTLTLANANWTLATDAGYFGYDGTKGQQIGSGSKPASAITLTTADIPGTITKIVVNTSGANGIDATFSVSVGETSFQYIDEEENTTTSASLTKEATDYTFTGSASGTITLSWANNSSKAIYVKSIYVEYTTEQPVEPAGWRDIKADLTQLQALATESDVYIKVAEDGTISQADNAEEAAATLKGKWHSTNYGWSNFTASVPVEGCVKITYATHDYGNDIIVTNSEGEEVAKLNTTGAKWSSNHDNVVVAYYRTNAPTTLHFSNANYNPYFAVEAIDEADLPEEVTVYNITFAAGDAEEGVAPAAKEVNAGESITMPKNYTLYKNFYTLTGWSDGTNTYAVGESVTPEADMTLTAVFSLNETAPEDFAEAVPITFVLNGNDAQYKFEGNKGIIVTQAIVNGKPFDVKADVDATNGKFAYNGSGWHQVNSGTKVIVSSCKGAKFAVSTYNDAASVTFGGEAGVADGNTATFEATSDDETLVIEQVSNNYWNSLTIIQPAFSDEPVAEWEYRDFGIDLVNILTDNQRVEQQAVELGVVIGEDGSQTQVAYGADNANISLKGKYWNDHGWVNTEATVKVEGPVQIDLGNCYYGNGDITVKDAAGAVVATGTMEQQHTCWGQDNSSIVSVQYKGEATTLTISYSSYLPYIGVKAITVDPEEPVNQDITGTWNFADAGIMEATNAFSGSSEAGEVEAMEKNGLMMIVEANGASFRNNGNNIQVRTGAVFKIPVKNAGDLVTVKGYPGYSYYTIGNSTVELNDENTYTAKRSDAEAGYVAVTSTNDNNYFLSLSVVQYAPKEKVTLDNEPATITFPFHEGTEGQTATFSNADYFLNSKVSHGNGLVLEGKDNKGFDETWFNPEAKAGSANEDNAIRFVFTPKPGLVFTPTSVSLKATRFGTDGGKLDFAWQNPDGTTVSLATGQTPNRDNGNDANKQPTGVPYSEYSYDFTSATAAEGTCGLLINLYSLDHGKRVGFSDIVIEGTLSGTEKDVPILASFKVNGNEYAVEDVFGESYEATLELPKAEQMVGQNNPLTDVTASSGEVGEITYEETDDACTVTIPMTAGDTQMNYVLNVVFKPDFTLSYLDVEGNVLTTQTVEKDAKIGQFAYDIENVSATKNGFKARGWFKQNYLGAKFTTEDVITSDVNLYAIETEMEVPSTSRKYVYNLTDEYFYDEDHEGFNSIGSGYWHDKQHGWAFNNGDQIELLVGPKATINFTLCQYSAAGATIEGSNGASVAAKVDNDGGAGSFDYEGEPGTLTLTINSGGAVYIHDITVFNTSEANFAQQGEWLIVKQGDASSLLDAIEIAKGMEGAKIFLPDGTYDLGETVQTVISGKNVSLIGQSAEKTIIVTRPPKEGLGTADLLNNTGEGLYMQDISLKNDFAYAGNDGRAASFHDQGTKTIGKNVFLLSHQDTYYSHKVGGLYYWEGGELHGTVDYLCGNGKAYFNEVKLVNEVRGSATITANSELYVFNNCTVENNAGTYNFGRAWSDNPVCIYLNTTLLDGGEKLASTRWNLNGLNCDYSIAGEYGTMDANGDDITPASNNVTFTKQNTQMNTILSADQAAVYTMEYVLGDWAATAKESARQLDAPAAKYKDGQVTWTPANNGAIAYALFKNGEFVGLTEGSSFDIEAADTDELTIRAANARGGFGEPAKVEGVTTAISELANGEQSVPETIYNLNGVRVEKAQKGLYIVNGKKVVVK